jgi:hypothetical protein
MPGYKVQVTEFLILSCPKQSAFAFLIITLAYYHISTLFLCLSIIPLSNYHINTLFLCLSHYHIITRLRQGYGRASIITLSLAALQ